MPWGQDAAPTAASGGWGRDAVVGAKPAPPPSRANAEGAAANPVTKFVATVNRAIPFADEFSAGIGAGLDVLEGHAPNLGAAWKMERDRQAGMVDSFAAEHPNASRLATGTGYAVQAVPAMLTGGASVAAEAPAAARAATTGGRAVQNAIRAGRAAPALATTGAAYSAVNAFADQGSLSERAHAANDAVIPGAVAGVAIPAGFNAIRGVGSKVAAGARNAMDPFLAATSRRAAERVAGRRLASAATDPAAVRNAINDAPPPAITGDQPTTFQLTGDLGLGAAEKAQANKTPEPFKVRVGDQNSARLEHLAGVQSGGDPVAVARSVTQALDALDAEHAGNVQAATARAQVHTNAMGGAGTPEGSGAALRTAISDSEAASKQRVSAIYDAVDPDETMTANGMVTKAAGHSIPSEMVPESSPMTADEARVFELARNLPNVVPLKRLIALRSQVSGLMRGAAKDPELAQTYRRLTMLRGAIETNLETTISERVASDQAAVASGHLAAEDAIASRYQSVVDNWRQERTAARTGTGPGDRANSSGGASGVPGNGGATVPSGGGLGSPAGNPGVPSDPLQPTVDSATVGQLKNASAANKAHHDVFDVQPVSGILRTQGVAGRHTMPDGSVPGSVWTGQANEFDRVTAAVRAGGPNALAVLQDHAAADLRAHAMTDGVIDPARFATWRAKHAGGLRALPPELQARFADAAAAGQAVGDAAVARTTALTAARQGAAARLLNLTDADAVTKTVGGIFGKANSTSQMRQLVQAVRGRAEATAGLRQAVADHITGQLTSNTEAATSGENMLRADQFQTFVRKNRPALAEVFSPAELARFDAIAESLHTAARSNNALRTAGSDTEQNRSLGARLLSEAGNHAMSMGGGAVGAALGSPHGGAGMLAGGGVGSMAGVILRAWRAHGVGNINELFTQALLNPDVARALLVQVPAKGGATSPAMTAALRRLSRALAAAGGVGAASTRATIAPPPNAMTYTPPPPSAPVGARNAFAP